MEVSRKQWILPKFFEITIPIFPKTLLAVCCWLHLRWASKHRSHHSRGFRLRVDSMCDPPKEHGKPLRNPWESERTARQVLDFLWLFADCVVTCATIKSDKWVYMYNISSIHCRDGPWVSFTFKSYKSWWQDGVRINFGQLLPLRMRAPAPWRWA